MSSSNLLCKLHVVHGSAVFTPSPFLASLSKMETVVGIMEVLCAYTEVMLSGATQWPKRSNEDLEEDDGSMKNEGQRGTVSNSAELSAQVER